MTESDTHAKANLIAMRVEQIRPLLIGLGPEVQSAILADLTSMYLAGLPPAIRDEFLDMLVDLARDLVPMNEKILFGPDGHPFKEPL